MKTSQWLYFHKAIDPKWCDDYVKWCEKSYQKVDSTIGLYLYDVEAKVRKSYR